VNAAARLPVNRSELSNLPAPACALPSLASPRTNDPDDLRKPTLLESVFLDEGSWPKRQDAARPQLQHVVKPPCEHDCGRSGSSAQAMVHAASPTVPANVGMSSAHGSGSATHLCAAVAATPDLCYRAIPSPGNVVLRCVSPFCSPQVSYRARATLLPVVPLCAVSPLPSPGPRFRAVSPLPGSRATIGSTAMVVGPVQVLRAATATCIPMRTVDAELASARRHICSQRLVLRADLERMERGRVGN